MNVVIAAGSLKRGITEAEMLAASDRFQREFVDSQPGVVRRIVVAGADGSYADIVFFANEAAIGEVMAAEQHSEVCSEFMSMWDGDAPVVYRILQTHG